MSGDNWKISAKPGIYQTQLDFEREGFEVRAVVTLPDGSKKIAATIHGQLIGHGDVVGNLEEFQQLIAKFFEGYTASRGTVIHKYSKEQGEE